MPPPPFFSIVVPAWNRGSTIGETIQSLLNQDFPHSQYEIIVVDDGSTDDTLDCLKPFASRLRGFHQQHSGTASARNRGIQHAKGEFIVCFDSDDILFPHALTVYKRAIDAFERPPVLLAADPIFFRTGDAIELASGTAASVKCIKCKDAFAKTVRTAVTNSIFILSKDRVVSAGGYSLDSHDDFDLLFQLGTASPMVKIIYPITVAYRLHERNMTRDPETMTQGALGFIRNERRAVYPGGSRRMLERRAWIGGHVLSLCFGYYLRLRAIPLHIRFAHIIRVLLLARGMIVVAFVRKLQKQYNRLYSQETHLPGYAAAEPAFDSGMADVNRRNLAAYKAWVSGSIRGDGQASAEKSSQHVMMQMKPTLQECKRSGDPL